jgi:hypothetical protein
MTIAHHVVMDFYDPNFNKKNIDFKKVLPDHSAYEGELW